VSLHCVGEGTLCLASYGGRRGSEDLAAVSLDALCCELENVGQN